MDVPAGDLYLIEARGEFKNETTGDLYTCDANGSGEWIRTDQSNLEATSAKATCADTNAVLSVALDDRFCIAQTHQLYSTDGAGNPRSGYR